VADIIVLQLVLDGISTSVYETRSIMIVVRITYVCNKQRGSKIQLFRSPVLSDFQRPMLMRKKLHRLSH
jgi:hypothetical protein